VHPFREEDKNNIQLQHLVEKYSATYFERTTVPFYMDINLKASKRIGKYLNLAFYVNRLLGIYPDYTLRGVLQRRTSESPYFGMEMNLTF
jgi:CMP-2-keto-3-deoxyoctulosonic acid synthetase